MKSLALKPIATEDEHRRAMAEIGRLWEARVGTAEHDRLEILTILVEKYEEEAFPIEAPDPIEAIVFRMEQMGLTRKDLEPLIGSRSRVYEILNRQRSLSLDMIRRLHATLKIPLESLIQEPTKKRSKRRPLRPAHG